VYGNLIWVTDIGQTDQQEEGPFGKDSLKGITYRQGDLVQVHRAHVIGQPFPVALAEKTTE
jgi:hypothetical protein